MSDHERFPRRCWTCDHPLAPTDRYCGHCGQGQDDFLAWYYRPLWIVVLALTVLGPFVLPLVWRTPRLDRTGKWVLSLAILALSVYVGWQFAIAVWQVGQILGGS